jgi:hypothetical protein
MDWFERKHDKEGYCCYFLCIGMAGVVVGAVVLFTLLALFGVFNIITAITGSSNNDNSGGYTTGNGPGYGCNALINNGTGGTSGGNNCVQGGNNTTPNPGPNTGTGSPPTTGSVAAYDSAVLQDEPIVFLRFQDSSQPTSTLTNYALQVNSDAQSWVWHYLTQAPTYVTPTYGQPSVMMVNGDTSVFFSGAMVSTSAETGNIAQIPMYGSASIELWFRTTQGGPMVGFVSICPTCGDYNPYWLYVWMPTGGQVAITAASGSSLSSAGTTLKTDTTYNDNQNHHFVAEYISGVGLTVYVDGVIVKTMSQQFQTSDTTYGHSAGHWYIAGLPPAAAGVGIPSGLVGLTYNGYLGQVSIYESTSTTTPALSVQRIKAHYAAGGGVVSSGAALDLAPTLSTDSQLYANAVVEDGPLLYWPMNDKGSAVSDVMDVMGSYLGVFTPSVANFTLTGETSGIAFQSANTSIDTASLFTLGTSVAAEVWVRPWVNTSSPVVTFPAAGLYAWVAHNGSVVVGIHNSSVATAAGLVSDNLWHQIVVTYRQQVGLWLYLDGGLQVGLTPAQLPPVVGSFGRWSLHGAAGTSVKRVSLYNSTLTAVQVNNHYTIGTL